LRRSVYAADGIVSAFFLGIVADSNKRTREYVGLYHLSIFDLLCGLKMLIFSATEVTQYTAFVCLSVIVSRNFMKRKFQLRFYTVCPGGGLRSASAFVVVVVVVWICK